MWYFSWILGTGLALAFGVLNAIWFEVTQSPPAPPPPGSARPDSP
ncbi:MAG TPA: cytochrome bd-I oxidase subunit CydX [Steroidobacteraceae bacterium]|jgi:cyd operon protein YbgT|nr:cytochrome bd-I oxidase subunit CydX [Steroidobacteraceae bacterium]